jgi:hypothetical protein
VSLEGQEPELERVKTEAARLRGALPSSRWPFEPDVFAQIKAIRERSAGFHAAIKVWAESLLPKSRTALDAEVPLLNPRLNGGLQRAGLIDSAKFLGDDFKPGLVDRVDVVRPPEDPDKLALSVGVGVPCGEDDLVYIFDYSAGSPRRVVESHGATDRGERVADIRFSKRDATGNQLILTLRYNVQCGSSWNVLSYDLFRLPATANGASPILSGEHDIRFGGPPYHVRLDPGELLIELTDRRIDAGMHSRAHVLHFNADGPAVERIDPVALRPRDFVEEWLTRPWTEMEPRSVEADREKLKKWHDFLAGGFVGGEIDLVLACEEKPGQWQVGVGLDDFRGKEVPERLKTYFLVQQIEKYRFEMAGISFDRQDGCPGDGLASEDSPTLFPEKKRRSFACAGLAFRPGPDAGAQTPVVRMGKRSLGEIPGASHFYETLRQ